MFGNTLLGALARSTLIRLTIYPLQLIKNRLQLMDQLLRLGILDRKYQGAIDCLTCIIKQQGFFALYKGIWVHLLLNLIVLKFGYDLSQFLKDKMVAVKQKDGVLKWFLMSVFKGTLTGSITLIISYSTSVAQTLMMNDIKKEYKDSIHAQKHIRSRQGILGLFTGFGISILGIALNRVLNLSFHQSFAGIVSKVIKNDEFKKFILSYGIAIITSFCCYPLDLIRQRMILAVAHKEKKYKDVKQCINQIKEQNEGKIDNFWKGAFFSVGKAIVLSITTYIISKRFKN